MELLENEPTVSPIVWRTGVYILLKHPPPGQKSFLRWIVKTKKGNIYNLKLKFAGRKFFYWWLFFLKKSIILAKFYKKILDKIFTWSP